MKHIDFYVKETKLPMKRGGTYSEIEVNGNHIATVFKFKDKIKMVLNFN